MRGRWRCATVEAFLTPNYGVGRRNVTEQEENDANHNDTIRDS